MATALKKDNRTSDEAYSAIETITPELAKQYLDLNMRNRSLVITTTDRYRRDMMAGKWRLSGDPIRFNRQGKLIDGQHRLKACIDSGVPFQSVVIRNLDDDVVNVIDSGRGRRSSDVLAIRGHVQTLVLAAAARWIIVMKANSSGPSARLSSLRPSHEEIIAIVDKHPLLINSIRAATNGSVGMPASLLSAIHYVGSHHLIKPAPERADAFVDVFSKGVPDYPGDPVHKLRELFLRDRLRKVYPAQALLYASGCYVWNLFAEKRPVSALRIPDEARIKGLLTENL